MSETKDLVASENGGFLPVDHDAQAGAVQTMQGERAIAEVQAQVVMAKRFPRDQHLALKRIETACRRHALAKVAVYSYPRGGQMISGPSIRLAEIVAQGWGNLDFGVREVSQSSAGDGVSELEAYAWDIETNVRMVKRFHVQHIRWTKQAGKKPVKDPRDVYEVVANQGARRMRACILAIVPPDILEFAVSVCRATMKQGDGTPLEDRIRRVVINFGKVGVPKAAIEEKLGHAVDIMTPDELVDYQGIYRAIKDGTARRENYFNIRGHASGAASAAALNEKFAPAVSEEMMGDKSLEPMEE